MRKSLWGWFRKLFSSYSKKTIHLYRIFLYKVDVYLLNRKKNKLFREIGKSFYTELLNNKETDQILETVQPIFSNLDKIDRKIEDLHNKIFYIAKKENISESDVEKIDKFIVHANNKLKDNIFEDIEEFDFEEDEADFEDFDNIKEDEIIPKKQIKKKKKKKKNNNEKLKNKNINIPN